MKKTIKSLLAIAISAFAFAACSDVPAPYDTPSEKPVNPHAYTGDGSVANPYTVADAIYLVQSLDGNETDQAFCVKGKVVAVSEAFNTQYGNGTFTISDDGAPANIFTAYRVLYLGNKKYTATDAQIQPGDNVIIYGKLVNYRGNTPETVQGTAFLYELNGVNRGGIDGGGGGGESADQPKGTGTVDNPFNVAAAVAKCQEAGGTATSQEYYVTGIVDAEYTVDSYKNATFDMVDNGFTQKFKAYRVFGPNGEGLKQGYKIPKGATVVVCGKLVNYGSNNPTPETAQGSGKLISVNGQAPELDNGEGGGGDSGGGGGDVSGNSIIATFADFGFTNAQEMTVITLTDGTTLTFDAGGGTTPKYYNAGTNIRMYAKNTMTINAGGGKKIASIEIACDTYNGTLCNASGDVTCDGTNMTIADASLKASGLNKASVTVANTSTQTGTPSQVRMTKLTITYQ